MGRLDDLLKKSAQNRIQATYKDTSSPPPSPASKNPNQDPIGRAATAREARNKAAGRTGKGPDYTKSTQYRNFPGGTKKTTTTNSDTAKYGKQSSREELTTSPNEKGTTYNRLVTQHEGKNAEQPWYSRNRVEWTNPKGAGRPTPRYPHWTKRGK